VRWLAPRVSQRLFVVVSKKQKLTQTQANPTNNESKATTSNRSALNFTLTGYESEFDARQIDITLR